MLNPRAISQTLMGRASRSSQLRSAVQLDRRCGPLPSPKATLRNATPSLRARAARKSGATRRTRVAIPEIAMPQTPRGNNSEREVCNVLAIPWRSAFTTCRRRRCRRQRESRICHLSSSSPLRRKCGGASAIAGLLCSTTRRNASGSELGAQNYSDE